MQDTLWIDKKGNTHLVSKMATSHILNCINLIKRRRNWRKEYLERLELELLIRDIQKRP